MRLKKRVEQLEKDIENIMIAITKIANDNNAISQGYNKRIFLLEQGIKRISSHNTVCDRCKIVYEREKRENQNGFICSHCNKELSKEALYKRNEYMGRSPI